VLDGTIYAINAALDMQGGSSLQTEMVVGTLTMGGNATILPPPHPSTAGSTFASIAWLDV
jgi:hypothetical protein